MFGLKCGADVDGNVREGSESGMLESGESRDSVGTTVRDKRATAGQWGGGLYHPPLYPNKAPPSPISS